MIIAKQTAVSKAAADWQSNAGMRLSFCRNVGMRAGGVMMSARPTDSL